MDRRHALLLTLAALCRPVRAAQADEDAERARIAAERRAAERRFAAEEAACSGSFAVNACVDEVRARRRQALADLSAQDQVLDDRRRKERAAERMRRIERKRIDAETPREGREAPGRPQAAERPEAASAPVAGTGPRAEAAPASRAEAARRRREQAEADQARIRERIAKRAARRKPVAGLPQPAASAP